MTGNGLIIMNKKCFILILIFMFSSCSITKNAGNVQVKGNGNVASEIRELSKFKAIEIAIGYDKILVNCGQKPSLHIVGDENILPLITTRVSKGILTIESDSTFKTESNSEIIINVESIEDFTFDGVGKTVIHNLNEDKFNCNINGVGSCELKGKVESFHVSVNGVGSVNAKQLIADDVVANLNGVGSVKLYAKNSLNASVNGVGGLTYFGNPTELILNDSGIGGITKGD